MNPLESRKQLLIAESELNRAQLVQEFKTVAAAVHSLASQAKTIRSFASAAATLVAGIVSFRPKKAPAREKTSGWQTLLKGAGLAGSLWSELRARSEK